MIIYGWLKVPRQRRVTHKLLIAGCWLLDGPRLWRGPAAAWRPRAQRKATCNGAYK